MQNKECILPLCLLIWFYRFIPNCLHLRLSLQMSPLLGCCQGDERGALGGHLSYSDHSLLVLQELLSGIQPSGLIHQPLFLRFQEFPAFMLWGYFHLRQSDFFNPHLGFIAPGEIHYHFISSWIFMLQNQITLHPKVKSVKGDSRSGRRGERVALENLENLHLVICWGGGDR